MDEEAAIAWQDVLDEINAGRPSSTRCPFCDKSPMKIEQLSGEPYQGGMPVGQTRISCTQCGKYIEGSFGGF